MFEQSGVWTCGCLLLGSLTCKKPFCFLKKETRSLDLFCQSWSCCRSLPESEAHRTNIHYEKATRIKKKWHPLSRNALNINADAAINKQKQQAGLAVFLKDFNSKIITALVKTSQLWKDVEAEVMEWGLKLAREATVSHLIMETNCQEIIDLVSNKKGSRTKIFWIISEIQNQASCFRKSDTNFKIV